MQNISSIKLWNNYVYSIEKKSIQNMNKLLGSSSIKKPIQVMQDYQNHQDTILSISMAFMTAKKKPPYGYLNQSERKTCTNKT